MIAAGRLERPSMLDDTELLRAAREEGVLPLIESLAGRWDRELRIQAALQLARSARIARLLNALASDRVTALVFKGAQLAYTHYPDPALRPRVDTDLFIDPRDVGRVRRIFEATGHRLIPHVSGEFVMSQVHFTDGEVGGAHVYDVHWRIANPALFRYVLPFRDVYTRSVPFDAYGAHSRGPSLPDALLIAAVHRAAHHGGAERLIWMHDVHLLLNAATPAELDDFCRLANAYGVSALAYDTCVRAAALFGDVPPVLDRLASSKNSPEPSRAYLSAPSNLRQLALDLRALRRWRERLVLLKEHAFPPAEYLMRTSTSRAPMPWLYATRIVRGAWQWFREGSEKVPRRFREGAK